MFLLLKKLFYCVFVDLGSNTGPVLFPTVRNDPSNPTPETADFGFFR